MDPKSKISVRKKEGDYKENIKIRKKCEKYQKYKVVPSVLECNVDNFSA